jgi:hypothetical protein
MQNIFMGKFDDLRYIEEMNENLTQNKPKEAELKKLNYWKNKQRKFQIELKEMQSV